MCVCACGACDCICVTTKLQFVGAENGRPAYACSGFMVETGRIINKLFVSNGPKTLQIWNVNQ